ncbi:MAG TPA: hypothetical protein VNQ48_06930 [Microbacteriaceae bacterium]|nr:hypothetical protein [Microbacteriaceae bacterium]
MSTETIAIVISTAALLLSFFGAFGWMVHRMDSKVDSLEAKLGARIDRVEQELVEVKVAIARLEGPPHRLLTAR